MENENNKKFDLQKTLSYFAFELPIKLYRSIIRHGYPDSEKNKSLLIFTNFFLHIFPVKVRKHAVKVRYSYCMGGITLLLFIILTITGGLLMFYYVPSTEKAYQNMKDLEFAVSFGVFLRNMHRWAAHGMVATVFLHMCRVFYTGAYKPPREFNWVIGVILFFNDSFPQLYRISSPLGSISILGYYRRDYYCLVRPNGRFTKICPDWR